MKKCAIMMKGMCMAFCACLSDVLSMLKVNHCTT